MSLKKNKLFSLIESGVPSHIFIPLGPFISGFLFYQTFNFSFLLILAFLSIALMVLGYNSFNAVFDVEIDKVNKPNRPLPDKKVSEKGVLFFSFFCFIFSLVLSFFVNFYFFILILMNFIWAIIYSLPPIRLKEKFMFSNISIAVQYGFFPVLMGWSVFGNPFEIPLHFLVSIILMAFSISFLKDFEDFFGDKVYDVKTLPVVFGHKLASVFSILAIYASYLLVLIFTFIGLFSFFTYIMVLFFIWISYIFYLLKKQTTGGNDFVLLQGILLYLFSSISLAILNLI